jgi:hypothetical protein
MRRARLLMPVLAAVLGIGAGVATAVVISDSDEADPPESFADPLHLGIPLVDLECTGESLLVVGSGDATPPLAAAVANNPDLPLRYLRTDDSCNTLWAARSQVPSEYVVYAGPYNSATEPCEARMDVQHKRDFVTKLTSGNQSFVRCPCELPVAEFPDLVPGMGVDPGTAIWIRSLQGLLVGLDDQRELDGDPPLPPYFNARDISGVYDETTEQRIAAYQPRRDIEPSEYGEVRFATWKALVDDACPLYDY